MIALNYHRIQAHQHVGNVEYQPDEKFQHKRLRVPSPLRTVHT